MREDVFFFNKTDKITGEEKIIVKVDNESLLIELINKEFEKDDLGSAINFLNIVKNKYDINIIDLEERNKKFFYDKKENKIKIEYDFYNEFLKLDKKTVEYNEEKCGINIGTHNIERIYEFYMQDYDYNKIIYI